MSAVGNVMESIGQGIEDLGDWVLGTDKKQPKPPTDVTDKELEAAAERQAAALRLRRGRSSTILTGPTGLGGTPPSLRKTTLG